MRRYFADTFFFLALLNERDDAHDRAVELMNDFDGMMVTTRWVLAEVANTLSAPLSRGGCVNYFRFLETEPDVEIVGDEAEMFELGLDLYGRRSDKNWSLTDCISFVVMQRKRIKEALTADHHFEQSGFVALMK